jgi:group I intron endonuclease
LKKKRIGLYEIVNLVNNMRIIGSAQDIDKRWSNYKTELSNGTYINRHLQDAISEYGAENFEFRVLEIVSRKRDLLAREKYWLDKFWDSGKLYNSYRIHKVEKKLRRGREAANHKAKMSKVQSGVKNPMHKGKLLTKDVINIKLLIRQGLSNKEIHTLYKDKTSYNMVSRIRTGDRYASVNIEDYPGVSLDEIVVPPIKHFVDKVNVDEVVI